VGEGEHFRQEAKALAEEIEIRFRFQQAAVNYWSPRSPRYIESEGIVRAAANVEGVVVFKIADEGFLFPRL